MSWKSVAIAVACIVLCAIMVSASIYYSQLQIKSRGKVKVVNIGAYWNYECTEEVTEIDWGTLGLGETATKTIYLKNTGNTNITVTMTVSDWQPQGNYANCTWNAENAFLTPSQVQPATLTLHIYQNATGVTNFSFTITITGTEA